MRSTILVLAAAMLAPAAARAQELDVARRSFPFIESRLEVAVVAALPGELQVIRGERGRIDVAARSTDGFPGFGLGGSLTPQLQLTAVGSGEVRYLVVVPHDVRVRVRLPNGESADIAPRAGAATYRWRHAESDVPDEAPPAASRLNGSARNSAINAGFISVSATHGLTEAYSSDRIPDLVDVPDLGSIRSLSLRHEGARFRIVASRPMSVTPGDRARLEIHATGEPFDLVLYVPRATGTLALYTGSAQIAEVASGQARAICGNVIVQEPSSQQSWLTFHPRSGRLECDGERAR
ncbi:hypothetical protein BH23GEM9_BH23GEM9_06190 [soil metagenome]